jgi:uncharacterized membrane-anchored protein
MGKMSKADNILETIIVALFVFLFVALTAGLLSSSFAVGIVTSLIVTFGGGFVLYRIRKRIF